MKGNNGFSLVELVVTVCIMAIVISVIAPQLIRYIEKSNVSSDVQLADTVRSAILVSATDSKVIEDPNSKPWLEEMEGPNGLTITNNVAFATSDCVLRDSLESSLGFPVEFLIGEVRSAHGFGCNCNIKMYGSFVMVSLSETDNTGRRDDSATTPENDIYID